MCVGCKSAGGTWDETCCKKNRSILSFVCKQVQSGCLSTIELGETAIMSVLYIRVARCKGNVRLEPQGVKLNILELKNLLMLHGKMGKYSI